jgi:hypothetical protein
VLFSLDFIHFTMLHATKNSIMFHEDITKQDEKSTCLLSFVILYLHRAKQTMLSQLLSNTNKVESIARTGKDRTTQPKSENLCITTN